jgi:uncharacterized protein (TIGR00661 family)
MLSLAKELKDDNLDIVISTYGKAYNYIKESGYQIHKVPTFMWYENPDGSFNLLKNLSMGGTLSMIFVRQYRAELNQISHYQPDLIISDARYSTIIAGKKYKSINNKKIPIIYVTNLLNVTLPNAPEGMFRNALERLGNAINIRMFDEIDSIVIPDLPDPYTICRFNLNAPPEIREKFAYTGTIVPFTNNNDISREVILKKYNIKKGPFIFAPLSGPGKSKEPVFEMLKNFLRDFDGTTLLTIGEPNGKKKFWDGNVQVRDWVEDRSSLMSACDLVICRPGLATIAETIYHGKPTILIPTPEHYEQEANTRQIQELGIGDSLDQKQGTKQELEQKIHQILNRKDIRKKLKDLQQLSVKNDGIKNLAEHIRMWL